ncbi:MAG: hypothetical protein WCF26_16880, partial [Candidatus Sulfotelmatobacter sp.]
RSGPKVGNAQTIYESEMAFFHECTQWCARIVLDSADIVRDRDFSPTDRLEIGVCMTAAILVESHSTIPTA